LEALSFFEKNRILQKITLAICRKKSDNILWWFWEITTKPVFILPFSGAIQPEKEK